MQAPFVSPPDELAGLAMFLDLQRASVLNKVDGVSEDDAWRAASVSSLSLATVLKHLAFVERRWFQLAVAGRDLPGLWPPSDPGEELRRSPDDTLHSVRAFYEEMVEASRCAIAASGGPDALCMPPELGINVRWVMLHLIEETARHAGHMDVIRESIDGGTGI